MGMISSGNGFDPTSDPDFARRGTADERLLQVLPRGVPQHATECRAAWRNGVTAQLKNYETPTAAPLLKSYLSRRNITFQTQICRVLFSRCKHKRTFWQPKGGTGLRNHFLKTLENQISQGIRCDCSHMLSQSILSKTLLEVRSVSLEMELRSYMCSVGYMSQYKLIA